MLTPLSAPETLDRARKVLQSGQSVGLPELLKLIESLSTNLGKSTISEIAELIERDPAVLSRVLSVANTLLHNPHVAPMVSIPQAIHQLGFNRVRTLAVSLMLLDNTGGANPPEQRAAAAHALCAGLMAQGCAENLGNLDPELAFACAALRQFGAIILPVVSLPLCREMQLRTAAMSEDQASRECFGLTPLELSRRLLRSAKLPEEVQHSLRVCPPLTQPVTQNGAVLSYRKRLLAVSAYSGQLAGLALDGSISREVFGDRSHVLARSFAPLLPGVEDTIDAALAYTDNRIGSFSHGQSSSSFSTPGLQQIRTRAHPKSPGGVSVIAAPPSPPAGPLATPPIATPPQAPNPKALPPTPAPTAQPAAQPSLPAPEKWLDALDHSAAFETQKSAATPPVDPWVPALAFVRDSIGAQIAWRFAPSPDGKTLTLTHGIGRHWQELRAKAVLRPDERTVFGVCLTRRENVVIHDSTERTLATYLPTWFRDSPAAPGAFILMPLANARQPAGLVLIGWNQPQRITVTPAQTEIARKLFASTAAPK